MSHTISSNWTWKNDSQINDERLLGQEKEFDQFDVYADVANAPLRQHSIPVRMRLVKNMSGGTLPLGAAVLHAADTTYGPYVGVNTVAGADSEKVAGFVPFWFPAVAAIGAIFPLVIQGPCKGLYVSAGNHALGENLKSAASGRLADWVKGTDEDTELIAEAMEAKTSGSTDDQFWIYAKPMAV